MHPVTRQELAHIAIKSCGAPYDETTFWATSACDDTDDIDVYYLTNAATCDDFGLGLLAAAGNRGTDPRPGIPDSAPCTNVIRFPWDKMNVLFCNLCRDRIKGGARSGLLRQHGDCIQMMDNQKTVLFEQTPVPKAVMHGLAYARFT